MRGAEPTAGEGSNSVCCINQSGCLTSTVYHRSYSKGPVLQQASRGLVYEKGAGNRFHRPCRIMSPGQLARLDWLCLTHFICCPLSTAGSIDLALGSLCLGCPLYSFCWYIPGMFKFILHFNLGSWDWCEQAPLPQCFWLSMGQKTEDCVDHLLVASSWPALGKEQESFSPDLFRFSQLLKCLSYTSEEDA